MDDKRREISLRLVTARLSEISEFVPSQVQKRHNHGSFICSNNVLSNLGSSIINEFQSNKLQAADGRWLDVFLQVQGWATET